MTALPTTIDKDKLLAKTRANLKRADALVQAFPMPAAGKPLMEKPAEEGKPFTVNVNPVPGEMPGVTGLKRLSKNKAMTALAMTELVPVQGITVMDACQVLREQGERAAAGDLSELQSTLAVQAIALDAIFTSFVHRAALAKTNDDLDRYLRLALKAQSQSRTSIESLAVIQQGPKIFAKQANVSNGGNQQVNNHAPAAAPASRARGARKPTEQTISKVAP
jgi:hypothetical protein